MGTEVNINPLFTIIGLILGELIWGISGLVLAIPLLAFVKIVCDHIPSLHPYGYLLGRDKTESFVDRMKNVLRNYILQSIYVIFLLMPILLSDGLMETKRPRIL